MAETLISSMIRCPICLGDFTDPRVLPCLHSFCLRCLVGHIDSTAAGNSHCSFPCPVCREDTRPPHAHLPVGSWGMQFRNNFIMTALASSLTESSRGKEKIEYDMVVEPCLPCCDQTPYPKEAKSFCLECNAPFCDACLQVHSSIGICRKHIIVPISDFDSRERYQQQNVHCEEHVEEILKLFCEDCNELLCGTCAMMKHRQCANLSLVNDVVATKRTSLMNDQRCVASTIEKAKKIQCDLQMEKEAISKDFSNRLREVDDAYDFLISRLKEKKCADGQLIRRSESEIQQQFFCYENSIEDIISTLNSVMGKMETMNLLSSDIRFLQETTHFTINGAEDDIAISDLNNLTPPVCTVPDMSHLKYNMAKHIVDALCLVANNNAHGHSKDWLLYKMFEQSSLDCATATTITTTSLEKAASNRSFGHVNFENKYLQCTMSSQCSTVSDLPSTLSASTYSCHLVFCRCNDVGIRNPQFISSSVKNRPPSRLRNSLGRRGIPVASVFSVKHPVVTAANSFMKPPSLKSSTGFVLVPSRNLGTFLDQIKSINTLASSHSQVNDALVAIESSCSNVSPCSSASLYMHSRIDSSCVSVLSPTSNILTSDVKWSFSPSSPLPINDNDRTNDIHD